MSDPVVPRKYSLGVGVALKVSQTSGASVNVDALSLFQALPDQGARLTDCGRIALIDHHLTLAERDDRRAVELRRLALLERWTGLLGPTQREHVTSHCEQVSDAARTLAEAMGLTDDQLERARIAGLLHDIGKCVIPEAILASRFPLSERQWAVMSCHAELGARIAARLGADAETVEGVRHHHTWYDDESVQNVTPIARIVCVADALVTMTSTRSYRIARSNEDALVELRRCARRQFDPAVVQCVGAVLMRRTWRRPLAA